MLPLSACIIAKNEELCIEKCLQSLISYVSEIIVVDTGSTDNTVSIARRYTDKVYSFVWCDDFAAAKNYAASLSAHDWILSIDCDESIEQADAAFLAGFLQPQNETAVGQVTLKNITAADSSSSLQTESISRIFSKTHYRFQGSVHEQLVPVSDFQKEYVLLPLSLLHTGYSSETVLCKKAHRNIRLLLQALASSPSSYLYYQLGQSYYVLKDYEHAAASYEKALALTEDFTPLYFQTLFLHYGYCLLELQDYKAALQFEAFAPLLEKLSDFSFLMGLIYMNNGLLEQAVSSFQQAVAKPTCISEGVNDYLAYYNIALIYECSGSLTEAEQYYKKCGSYPAALTRLTHLNENL